MLYEYLIAPFADFGFMRRALVASLALSVGGSAIGVFLILRRMSLMGDALAHSLLPGAALGFPAGWPVAAGHEPRRASWPASPPRWCRA